MLREIRPIYGICLFIICLFVRPGAGDITMVACPDAGDLPADREGMTMDHVVTVGGIVMASLVVLGIIGVVGFIVWVISVYASGWNH